MSDGGIAVELPTVAALYVERGGVYFGQPGVDPWDEQRDARLYDGPYPIVGHSPCQRWGRYALGGPSHHGKFKLGDDAGCFAACLAAVRKWGGILEHPEASHAWRAHGLLAPPRDGGWVTAGDWLGWTCCVEQGHYGHPARKATWLYAVGCDLPSLLWGSCGVRGRMDDGFHSTEERRKAVKRGVVERLTKRERLTTPPPFRDLLLSIARTARRPP